MRQMASLRNPRHLREIARLGLPVGAEYLLTVLLSTVNTMIASHLGKEAITAIGMSDALNLILMNFFASFAVGSTVVTAHCTGRDDHEGARDAAGQSLSVSTAFALLVGAATLAAREPILSLLYRSAAPDVLAMAETYLLWSVLSYPFMAISSVVFGALRGTGDTRTPMAVSVAQSVANLGLSSLLIYGVRIGPVSIPGYGIGGAAAALTLVRFFGAVAAVAAVQRKSSPLRLTSLRHLMPQRRVVGAVLSVGIPTGAESLLFNAGKMFSQIILVSLGTVAGAANYIAGSISGLLLIPGNALSITTTTMIGQRMGRGAADEADRLMRSLLVLSHVLLFAVGLVSLPILRFTVSLYTSDAEVAALAVTALTDYMVAMTLAWSVSFLLPAGLRATGDARFTMIVAVASMWIVRIAFGYVLGVRLGFGMRGIWFAMYIDWAVRGALFWLRFAGGRWKRTRLLGEAEPAAATAG